MYLKDILQTWFVFLKALKLDLSEEKICECSLNYRASTRCLGSDKFEYRPKTKDYCMK